jgi:predicted acyltransferase
MHARHGIAVVAVILIGLGIKLLFFPAPAAEANTPAVASASMNVLQMHKDHPNIKSLEPQKLQDMTFVFSQGD